MKLVEIKLKKKKSLQHFRVYKSSRKNWIRELLVRLLCRQAFEESNDALPEQKQDQQVRDQHQVKDPAIDVGTKGRFVELASLLRNHAALRATLRIDVLPKNAGKNKDGKQDSFHTAKIRISVVF